MYMYNLTNSNVDGSIEYNKRDNGGQIEIQKYDLFFLVCLFKRESLFTIRSINNVQILNIKKHNTKASPDVL